MNSSGQPVKLRRAINLPKLILYGLGTTIGAGIYVLVGETAARAGYHAPLAFALSAVVMAFSAASFAEFCGRAPHSAGEAVYIDKGFGKAWLSALVGYIMILAATVSAAAISRGCAGYVMQLVPLPEPVILCAIFIGMGTVAAWGIRESVTVAAVLTLIEIVGLLIIVFAGVYNNPDLFVDSARSFEGIGESAIWVSVLSASLIAFFAFIGFDDMVNVAEETIEPARTMPIAIIATLSIVTILYILVSLVALDALSIDELGTAKAPIGLLFERLTGMSPISITLIAIAATINGIVIQIIMGSRVAYGLAKRNYLPGIASKLNSVTRTPLYSTITISAAGLLFALYIPLDRLAQFTSQMVLIIFFLVNVALVLVKSRGEPAPENVFIIPMIIPITGAVCCLGLFLVPFLIG